MDIGAWLRELGLEEYEQALRDNQVDARSLPHLTADDLKEMGVMAIGHRRLLLQAIADLQPRGDAAVELASEPVTPGDGAGDPAGRSTRARPEREAERRQLTVMFVDLVGSTALAAALDPEDMREVIRDYQNVVVGEIARFEGHVAKFMGDGVLAYFGWPKAHEDDAERALRAGLDLVAAVARLAAPDGQPLACRVGVATGLVVVGDLVGVGAAQEEAVVGETPNLAARLQGLAAPGQIVLAESTRRLLGDLFELADLGPQRVKGIALPVGAFTVTGERFTSSRFEARSGPALLPMVGRDQELALLLERWARTEAGEGQGVLLVGEAGIGKSRIARALLDAVAEEPHIRVRYQCSPYHGDSAFWPVIQQLSHAAGFASDDPVEVRLDELEGLLGQATGEVAAVAPLIADLIGLDGSARYGVLDLAPQVQRARTLAALVDQLLGLAARQPVLVVLEDAHWIDPTTLEMIGQGLDRIAAAPVLILLTSRPDGQPKLAAHPHVTRLTLNRLGRAGVEAIVAGLWAEAPPSAKVTETIIARTDGVPLFVEELTKAVLESGETAIPASLHDSLMARLDRIPEVKEIAQVAACIGRAFGHPLLAAIVDRPGPALRAALDRLVGTELVFRRGTPPEATYSFKHALVRDAAYESLLKSRRQKIHAQIARTLETGFSVMAENEPEVVAQHWNAAGDSEHALAHWRTAARRATGRSAYREAVAFFEQALAALDPLPESDDMRRLAIDLRLEMRPALGALGEYGQILQRHREAGRHARDLDDRQRLAKIEADLPLVLYQLGQTSEAIAVGDRARRLADQAGDRRVLIQATFNFGMAQFFAGQYHRAVEIMLEFVDELKGPYRHERLGSTGTSACNWLGNIAGTHARLGEFEPAIAYGEEAVQIARETGRPFDMCIASLWLGTVHVVKGEAKLAAANFDRLLQLAQENELGFIVAWAGLGIAEAYQLLGKTGEAAPIVTESLAMAKRFKLTIAEAWSILGMGQLHLATGSPEDAAECGRRALEIGRSRGLPWCEGVAMRLLGSAFARLGPEHFTEAGRYLTDAVARATDLQARPELAHAWRERGMFLTMTDRPADGRLDLVKAIDLYRATDMAFWLRDTEALLDEASAGSRVSPPA